MPSVVRIHLRPRNLRAEVAQLIEHQPSKLRVASLSLVFRSKKYCQCSSGVEHFLGKEEVAGSNPAIGSTLRPTKAELRFRGVCVKEEILIITTK